MNNISQPQQHPTNSSLRRRIKSQTLSRNQFKGITLKQYFRLVDKQSNDHPILQQVRQQEVDSSRNSLTETPAFGQPKRNLCKMKVKTEATQQQFENYHNNNNKSTNFNIQCTTKLLTHKKNNDLVEKLNTSLIRKVSCSKKPQKKRTQKLKTISLEQIDLSTMNAFYKHKKHINEHTTTVEKRQKMLQKIQADKDRTVDLNQKDIFCITKYANKFNIDTKKLLQ